MEGQRPGMNKVLWVAVDNKNHSENYLEIKKRAQSYWNHFGG